MAYNVYCIIYYFHRIIIYFLTVAKCLFRETFFFSDLCDGFVVWRKHPAKHGFLEFWTVVHV